MRPVRECFLVGLAVMGLAAFGLFHQAQAESCFDHDLFRWDREVNYRRALASETLAPKRATIGGRTFSTGQTDAILERALGPKCDVAEDWSERDAEHQCEYLRSLGASNSNSMHYYILEEQNRRHLAGWFRVCQWKLPGVGTLRAFLHRRASSGPAEVYLLQLVVSPIPEREVSYSKGSSLRVVRAGPPRVEWDVQRNFITIGSHDHD